MTDKTMSCCRRRVSSTKTGWSPVSSVFGFVAGIVLFWATVTIALWAVAT